VIKTVTIDFHNTLVECDPWFILEVKTLAAEFLRWRGNITGTAPGPDLLAEATRVYRTIRVGVIQSGRERDAVDCVEATLRIIRMPVDPALVEQGVAVLMRACVPSATPVEGAPGLVHALHDAGVQLAVVSSAAYHPFLEWSLSAHGMLDSFQAIVTSASCGIYKSDPEIYRHTLRVLDADPATAVHIGDSQRFDVASAGHVGMATVWYDRDGESLTHPLPNLSVRSLAELTLESLCSARASR
jgi:FMN phosphatase YigB (HAD superfamily)